MNLHDLAMQGHKTGGNQKRTIPQRMPPPPQPPSYPRNNPQLNQHRQTLNNPPRNRPPPIQHTSFNNMQ